MSALSAITGSARAARSAKKKEKIKAKIAARRCTFCNEKGHKYAQCPLNDEHDPQPFDPAKGCTNCGNPGHWAADCQMDAHVLKLTTTKAKKRCTICKEWKHLSFECPLRFQQPGGKGFSLTKPCVLCGNTGHWARECIQSRKGYTRKRGCKWCGKKDHPNYECPSRNKLVNRRKVDNDKRKRITKEMPMYYWREREGAPLSLKEVGECLVH